MGRRDRVYRRGRRRYGREKRFRWKSGVIAAAVGVALVAGGVCTWYFLRQAPQQAPQAVSSVVESSAVTSAETSERVGSTPEHPYQTLYPEMYVPKTEKIGATAGEKTVYLTFNNAPGLQTEQILQVLEQQNVQATFFVYCNEQSEENLRSMIAQMAEKGHTVGVLTDTADYARMYASVENYLEDFHRVFALITEATGEKPAVFRFAGGSVNGYNRGTIKEIAAEMTRRGFTYHDWSLDSADTVAGATGERVYQTVVDGILNSGKSVVLLDNNAGVTLEQLPAIIAKAKENGYRFQALNATTKPFTMAMPD